MIMTCLPQRSKTKSPPSTRQRAGTTKTIQYLTMPRNREQCTTKTTQYLTMPLTREQCTTTSQQRAMYNQDYTVPHNASHQRAMYNHLSTESNVRPRLYSTSQCLSPESNVQPPLNREQCTTKTIQYLTMPLNREQCTTKTIQHNTMPVIPPFLPPSVRRPRHFSGAGRAIRPHSTSCRCARKQHQQPNVMAMGSSYSTRACGVVFPTAKVQTNTRAITTNVT